jgi:hypothetical protein
VIYFWSPSLDRLVHATAEKPLANLHLRVRTINPLRGIGIQSIGDLINQARRGIVHFRAAGEVTRNEIFQSLEALVGNIRQNGQIDWIGYAKTRGLALLPARKISDWSGTAFVSEFPNIAEAVVRMRYGSLGLKIFRARLLAPSNNQPSLEITGKRLKRAGVSIRDCEQRIVQMFRQIVQSDEYQDCSFRIRKEFLKPLRSLAEKLRSQPRRVLSRRRWQQLLQSVWGIRADQVGAAERLIFEILGYRPIAFNTLPGTSTMRCQNQNARVFGDAKRRSIWNDLRIRLSIATRHYGGKAELARKFRVTRQAVHKWLSGRTPPSAERTLHLLGWVRVAEMKEKKGALPIAARPGKARKRKTTEWKTKVAFE